MSGGVRGRKFLNQRNFLLLDLSVYVGTADQDSAPLGLQESVID